VSLKSAPPGPLPLCVDLDGTLLHIDTLHESAFAAAFDNWRVLLRLPGWLGEGKARVKAELAKRWRFNPATLPYNAYLLDYIRAQREAGRYLVLCTAADRSIAERVAEHLGLFDEVIASDGYTNLRGESKAEALRQRFGEGGFAYAGNDSTDFPVWDSASEAVVVNASGSVLRAAQSRYQVAATFADRGSTVRALVHGARPYQWVKNLLCFVPQIAAGDFSAHGWLTSLATAAAFSFIASGVYILNDISDLSADRAHPRKSRRPFASGAAPIAAGLTLLPAMLLAGAFFGAITNGWPALATYLTASLLYNFWFKEKPLIDVFTLAALYTLRLFGGSIAGGYGMSLWLLGFSSFLFLSVAIIKRVCELRRLRGTGSASKTPRRGYRIEDIAILEMFGVAASFTSALVLSLYVQSDTASRNYGHPTMLWGSVPLMLFWQCRLWLSTSRGHMHDDPILFAVRDRVSWVVFACLAALVVMARLPSDWPLNSAAGSRLGDKYVIGGVHCGNVVDRRLPIEFGSSGGGVEQNVEIGDPELLGIHQRETSEIQGGQCRLQRRG
jgi:4-hydroxybenzoate polyprenyltransferase/phosphoserine phosphatase